MPGKRHSGGVAGMREASQRCLEVPDTAPAGVVSGRKTPRRTGLSELLERAGQLVRLVGLEHLVDERLTLGGELHGPNPGV